MKLIAVNRIYLINENDLSIIRNMLFISKKFCILIFLSGKIINYIFQNDVQPSTSALKHGEMKTVIPSEHVQASGDIAVIRIMKRNVV